MNLTLKNITSRIGRSLHGPGHVVLACLLFAAQAHAELTAPSTPIHPTSHAQCNAYSSSAARHRSELYNRMQSCGGTVGACALDNISGNCAPAIACYWDRKKDRFTDSLRLVDPGCASSVRQWCEYEREKEENTEQCNEAVDKYEERELELKDGGKSPWSSSGGSDSAESAPLLASSSESRIVRESLATLFGSPVGKAFWTEVGNRINRPALGGALGQAGDALGLFNSLNDLHTRLFDRLTRGMDCVTDFHHTSGCTGGIDDGIEADFARFFADQVPYLGNWLKHEIDKEAFRREYRKVATKRKYEDFDAFRVGVNHPGQYQHGDSGPDGLLGGAGTDFIAGGEGDDVIIGGRGNDVLVGQTGVDTAVYSDREVNYELMQDDKGDMVILHRNGVDGADRLRSVETLEFNDGRMLVAPQGKEVVLGKMMRPYWPEDNSPSHFAIAFAKANPSGPAVYVGDDRHTTSEARVLTSEEIAGTRIVQGSAGSRDVVHIAYWDGEAWSDWSRFILHTPLTDSDGDAVPNSRDNCPAVANSNQRNFDRDRAGDACDADDDNDGMPDDYERANQLNPRHNDSKTDKDRDGVSNLAEYRQGSRANDPDSDNDGRRDDVDPQPAFNEAMLSAILGLLTDKRE